MWGLRNVRRQSDLAPGGVVSKDVAIRIIAAVLAAKGDGRVLEEAFDA